MNALEHRFEGKQANARAIQAFVNRHLQQQGQLQRIEVRLSSEAPQPTELGELRRLLTGLLSEHGQGKVQLSLRRFERAIDNAAGEHQVRMIFAEQSQTRPQAQAPGARASWWRRLIGRPTGASAANEPVAASAAPAGIPQKRAVEMLREALASAVRYDGAELQGQPVARISVRAHLPEIDTTLRAMMPPQDPQAALSVAAMLQRLGVACRPGLCMDYRFEPRASNEGTQAVLDADLRVTLSAAAATEAGTAQPRALADATALPDAAQLARLRRKRVRARVLGTVAGDFPTPFEFDLGTGPARLDRAALEAAGFGFRHGTLLRVASQSCPLQIERLGDTGLLLRPSFRPEPDAAAMYYTETTGQALPAELRVETLPLRFVLNSPTGVRDSLSGEALPALRIELWLE